MRSPILRSLFFLLVACSAQTVQAEMVALDIYRREPFAGGVSFGDSGRYEKLVGVARFAVDPSHLRNRAIVDLERATGTQGVALDTPNGFTAVSALAWSPKGRLLGVAEVDDVAIVDTATWRTRSRLSEAASGVAFLPKPYRAHELARALRSLLGADAGRQ